MWDIIVAVVVAFISEACADQGNQVLTKVAVALGATTTTFLHDIEVIDLASNKSKCMNLPNFPYGNEGAVGGLGFEGTPIICGGASYQTSCNYLFKGKWNAGGSLNEPRFWSAVSGSPFLDDGTRLFITGGQLTPESLSSSEVLTETGWKLSTPLPVTIHAHCMVKLNATTVMVIGGFQGPLDQPSGNTYIFNSRTNIWSPGPALNQEICYHSCAVLNGQTKKKSIVVAGVGSTSTSILDVNSMKWSQGPALPMPVIGGAMVEDPSGGVVFIGGHYDTKVYNTLYKLSNSGPNSKWDLMKQKLKTGRDDLTAFLIPDKLAYCN